MRLAIASLACALVLSAFMFDDAGAPTWYLAAGAMTNRISQRRSW